MKLPVWVRRTHKWIGLVIGVQALLWMISGVYMTVISLEVIHGDHLAHVAEDPLRSDNKRLDVADLAERHPGFNELKLKTLLNREVYQLKHEGAVHLLDAQTGERLNPLSRESIEKLAIESFQGDAKIREIRWITQAPSEVARRPVPMWAVVFDDFAESTLYFSPDSGDVLARRHDLWRWFDFVWMLHIMDYDQRTDVNNSLLRISAGLGVAFALSGLWLVFYTLRRRAVK
jgi:uncharacterized iron-regulated membrane protein